MKKLFLTLVAVMTMSFANAETEAFRTQRHVVNYDMSFDLNRLAAKMMDKAIFSMEVYLDSVVCRTLLAK